jgi:hypothetical protein
MKRKILVVMASVLMLVTMLATVSAMPAVAQPNCDWYEAGFDRNFGTDWWGYWCRDPDTGWYLVGWWSYETGFIYAGG